MRQTVAAHPWAVKSQREQPLGQRSRWNGWQQSLGLEESFFYIELEILFANYYLRIIANADPRLYHDLG
jgi:hypothetical protein